ncbi:MAG: hypothetical protein ACTS6P_01210 [Candidatus Hodgkinia cicadicola]
MHTWQPRDFRLSDLNRFITLRFANLAEQTEPSTFRSIGNNLH